MGIPVLISALALSAPPLNESPPMIDGYQKPHRTHVSYRFECGATKVRLGYREERRSLKAVNGDFLRAMSVDLTDLKVSGRRISVAGRATVEKVIAAYGWIESVRAECFGAEVKLYVLGMDRERWAASFREASGARPWRRPDTYLRGITFSPAGAVSVS